MPTHFGVKNRMVLQFRASLKVETRWTLWTCILLEFPILFPSFSMQFRVIDIYIWQLFLWIKHVLLESQDLKNKSCCIGPLHLPYVAAKSQVCNYLQCFPRISFKKSLLPQIIHLRGLIWHSARGTNCVPPNISLWTF